MNVGPFQIQNENNGEGEAMKLIVRLNLPEGLLERWEKLPDASNSHSQLQSHEVVETPRKELSFFGGRAK